MNFELTKDQIDLLGAIKNFVSRDKILNDGVYASDDASVFSKEKWRRCSEIGILGLPVPKKYGGLGESMLTTALAIRELSRNCLDEGLVFSLCAHLCTCMIPILVHGTEEQKLEFLPKLISGELIGGNGSTESDAGSDLSMMQLEAHPYRGGYLLNGEKIFVTNGSIANILIIYAKHSEGLKFADISAFIVHANGPGFKVGQTWNKMGLRTSPLSEIILEDYFSPSSMLLGRERRGILTFNESMFWERIIMPAYHLGAMELQFNKALEYSSYRKQFGSPIIAYQRISEKLVDMKRNIDTALPLLYQTCWRYDRGAGNASMSDAAMLKLHVSSGKVENSLNAVQIFGASGYIKGSQVEKQLRDSVASTIYSGTSEIQKKLIVDTFEEYK